MVKDHDRDAREFGPEPRVVPPDADSAVENVVSHGEMPFRPGRETPQPPPEDTSEARIDRLLRALADAENARRRAERTSAEARQYAIGDFARDLLTVADNLQRALTAADSGGPGNEQALIEGVRATDRLLKTVIERYGVRKIDSLGAPFDPKLHEAVMVVEDERRDPGTVVEVVEEGYMLHDRLLRPARVFVNNPNMKPAMNLHGQEPG